MRFTLVFIVLCGGLAARAQTHSCEAPPAILAEIRRAESMPVTDPTAFDRNVAPFLALRERHPGNLFVHERYQDAVRQYGIEGHLRILTQDYQALSAEHPDDVMDAYLSARSLVGRSTPSAIASLTELLGDHPDLAPAHRTLAEIYASDAFRDPEKARTEREEFLALCPGAALTVGPGTLPERSPLIDQAEQLLSKHADPDRVAEMALQGIRDDEWRLQRIRPFDWYSVQFKRQAQQELQGEYWQLWRIQVRCYRRAGQQEKATTLLELMEQRAGRLRDNSAPLYWEAQASLARLYIEGNQTTQATAKLSLLNQVLSEHPDPNHEAGLRSLRMLMN